LAARAIPHGMPGQRIRVFHLVCPIRRCWNHVSGGSGRPPFRFARNSGRDDFDCFCAGTSADPIRRGNTRPALTDVELGRCLVQKQGLPLPREGRAQNAATPKLKVFRYATTRALIGVPPVTEAPEAARSDSLTMRAASGFSHSKAMNAAIRSHAIMAQKTLLHDPVFA
jgi:hypothetical protein